MKKLKKTNLSGHETFMKSHSQLLGFALRFKSLDNEPNRTRRCEIVTCSFKLFFIGFLKKKKNVLSQKVLTNYERHAVLSHFLKILKAPETTRKPKDSKHPLIIKLNAADKLLCYR